MDAHIKGGETIPATLRIFTFTLVLSRATELTEDIANALYEAGCDDAGIGSCEGVLTAEFDREAESLGETIGSAIGDVERAGSAVSRVDVGKAPVPRRS